MRKLVRGGTVVTATHSSVADVLVDDEEIVAVGSLGDVDAEVIDAAGCFVLPGLIDNHTHMAMPFGGTHSIDDYNTGTRAAAAGGTTCIVDFVIQQHPDGLRSSLEEWQARAEGAAHVDYGFHIAITQADDGTFADMAPMVEEGVCTFKVFLAYKGQLMVTDDLFFRVLEHTRDLGALTMVQRRTAGPSTSWSSAPWRPARPIRSSTPARARRSSRPRPRAALFASPS